MNQVRERIWMEQHGVGCQSQVLDMNDMPVFTHSTGKLLYAESGTVYVITENNTWYLVARHYIWIPAGVRHKIQTDMARVVLRALFFHSKLNEPAFFKEIGIYPVNDLLLEMIDYTKNWKGIISPEEEDRFTFVMAIKAILPALSKHKLPFELPLAKDTRLKKVTAYIHENLSKHLHVSEIAQQFGLSERSLARLFQNDLRMSYIKYLRTLRIIHALELLSTTKLSVNEIAFKVGYDSFPTFSNMFFQMVGIRPKAYLQQKI